MSRKPTDRRDALKAMFAGESDGTEPQAETKAPTRAGAVKAMGLQLGSLERKLDDAAGQGERIVELDPDLIDSAFVADRLAGTEPGDDGFAELVESIRDGGQQVPVLVRPNPDEKKRFQAAYGHRRIAACREAGIAVKAIIRDLSDGELVLAQGRENALRRDLSFIEKARFAAQLVTMDFSRADIQRALALHAADMTRMLAVASSVPAWAATAIGPAPKAGRARWQQLAKALDTAPARAKARKIITSGPFKGEGSDARFARVLDAVTVTNKPDAETLKNAAGRGVATISGSPARPTITIDSKAAPALLDAIRNLIANHKD
ncbi:plasmid partitioning protein RepB [Ahrensia sp. R2A130]|uniref:plasmid partitioning protein RepB n=1 Tax=Ahrensia sp. R2A130 TaxID=744979 RepID=UPI0001E0F136|nr:plasmid partitioning protein RepB [Ahrensia sp. R2A130]EFL87440.1 plasmid partitioning protein RepB [Ahrensia sp. R2A130]